MADLAAIAASLGEVLHRSGIPATPERQARFAASIVDIAPSTLNELYWIGRVTLVSDREQIEIYDKVLTKSSAASSTLTSTYARVKNRYQ